MSHLPEVHWVENSPKIIDHNPVTLTFNLLFWPSQLLTKDLDLCDLDLGPTYLKVEAFKFLTLVTLTYDLQSCARYDGFMWVPNFRFGQLGPTVKPAERKRMDTHTDTIKNITSFANTGGKYSTDSSYCFNIHLMFILPLLTINSMEYFQECLPLFIFQVFFNTGGVQHCEVSDMTNRHNRQENTENINIACLFVRQTWITQKLSIKMFATEGYFTFKVLTAACFPISLQSSLGDRLWSEEFFTTWFIQDGIFPMGKPQFF